MTLLRRLTAIASQPGELDPPRMQAAARRCPGGSARRSAPRSRPARASRYSGSVGGSEKSASRSRGGIGADSSRRGASMIDGGGSGGQFGEELTGLMAVNLIRAHREELVQASSGKLDHMVIDVVGSLFDQILSDSRVPPQMAREIARLQLPVLRVALSDATFFSTRRHPVRRFINRIASLANAFDEFDAGPGAKFLSPGEKARRRDRRGRLRPDRPLRRQGHRARALHRRAERRRGRADRRGVGARRQGVGAAHPAALHAAAAGCAQSAAAARIPAHLPGPGLEPGAGARDAPRRPRFRSRQALSPRRRRHRHEHPAEGLADVPQEVPDAAAAADEGPERGHAPDRLAGGGAEGVLRQAAAGACRVAEGTGALRARPQPDGQAARGGVRDAGAIERELHAHRRRARRRAR